LLFISIIPKIFRVDQNTVELKILTQIIHYFNRKVQKQQFQ
jgi:hypothetical protein